MCIKTTESIFVMAIFELVEFDCMIKFKIFVAFRVREGKAT